MLPTGKSINPLHQRDATHRTMPGSRLPSTGPAVLVAAVRVTAMVAAILTSFGAPFAAQALSQPTPQGIGASFATYSQAQNLQAQNSQPQNGQTQTNPDPGATAPRPTPAAAPPAAMLPLPTTASPSAASISPVAAIQPSSALQLPAHKAVVSLGASGLYIKAENSNLSQIMRDISSATGTKVSGLAGEERIFGTYGPAGANDVMNALLYGSDYNVVMVGRTSTGAPREVLLTRRNASAGQTALPTAKSDEDSDAGTPYEDTEPPQPTAFPPGMARAPVPPPQNPVPGSSTDETVKTPQQLLDQLQQLHQQDSQQTTQPVVTDTPIQQQ